MKSKLKGVIVLFGVSCAAALLCTLCIYKVFPQYLCYTVYDVSESDLYERESRRIAPGTVYTEQFTPRNSYLKSIAINLETVEKLIEKPESLEAVLSDEKGKTLEKAKVTPEYAKKAVYCEFPVEKWVAPGKEYQFMIKFPEQTETIVTFGPADIGPEEHIRLISEEEEPDGSMYFKYVYGSYSKKLLVFWFLVFFVSACYIGEFFIDNGKQQKRIFGKSK